MLIVYTFVFGLVFKSKWAISNGNTSEFAVILFTGMIGFNIFSEVITRSATIILNNPNYVKKVIFPLEVFPVVLLGSALVHAAISFIILLLGLLVMGIFNWTIIFLPLILVPLFFFSLGLAWFFSSIGVYFRDIGQALNIAVSALMFLTPIFYPVSSIPKGFEVFYHINIIAYVVEDLRNILIFGKLPNWQWLGYGTTIGLVFMVAGFIWFQKTRKGFADIL
jgi:lipopolysaccharide transport system permease protein